MLTFQSSELHIRLPLQIWKGHFTLFFLFISSFYALIQNKYFLTFAGKRFQFWFEEFLWFFSKFRHPEKSILIENIPLFLLHALTFRHLMASLFLRKKERNRSNLTIFMIISSLKRSSSFPLQKDLQKFIKLKRRKDLSLKCASLLYRQSPSK